MWVEADKTVKTYESVKRQENLSHHLFSFSTPPSFMSVFFCMKREKKQHRCDGMDNEAVPWPSKHFLCLAWVFSCFTSTSAVAENKKHKTKK